MNAAIEITSIDEAQELEPLEIARRLYDSAVARYAEGHIRLAESLFRRALYLFGKHYESGRSGAIGAMINLGVIYEDRFEYGAAEQLYHRAVMTVEGATGYGDTNLAQLRLVLWSHLAHINRVQGRHDQAEACARLRLEVAERFFGPDSLGAAD